MDYQSFRVPVFNVKIDVFFTPVAYEEYTGDDPDSQSAGFVVLRNGYEVAIAIYDYNRLTIVHESVHAAYEVCKILGHKPSYDDQEIVAHLSGIIGSEVFDAYNRFVKWDNNRIEQVDTK